MLVPELLRFFRMALVVILGFFLASRTTILASAGVTFGFLPHPFEIFHSMELLVLSDDALHCGHWHLKTLGYGFVAFSPSCEQPQCATGGPH
uniref:Uncharacterized protein n=1 Tax=Anguilla anguilla TaxID=7936 RepID=A0A0E9VMU2_ANGAN